MNLQVGYSTCHWCHVMERESFESAAIADIMNKHFVSVKVDREERCACALAVLHGCVSAMTQSCRDSQPSSKDCLVAAERTSTESM